jgi:hypothetical protein
MEPMGRLWIAAGGLALAAFGQNAVRTAPIPNDPLELVTGQILTVDTPEARQAVVELLKRARTSYSLQTAGHGYDLKVTFAVNSGGQTQYDGRWEMEDIFDPVHGMRWTAKATAGYATTQISANKMYYADGPGTNIPLRLHEARAALFGPMGTVEKQFIRTSTATYNGVQVTCALLSSVGGAAAATNSRRWEETKECIDPQSGLLAVHSQVPGRYYAYDYSNAPQLGGNVLPGKVTEGGKVVSEITVEGLTPLASADPSMFTPTAEMAAEGPSIAMVGAQKIARVMGQFRPGATAQPVCVFGLVTPSGQRVEAPSLQPSDPNSQAAVEAAMRMNFSQPAPPGVRPEQRFEKFVGAQQGPGRLLDRYGKVTWLADSK